MQALETWNRDRCKSDRARMGQREGRDKIRSSRGLSGKLYRQRRINDESDRKRNPIRRNRDRRAGTGNH